MFLKVYCPSDIVAGDVLHFNSTSQLWERATTIDHPICVARTSAVVRDAGYSVDAVFAGAVFAKASRSIPVQGGELQVENGAVYVDNNANGQGIICPQFIDNTDARNAGDLVQVVIR
jgi:hypothetical protein|tara:strand:- start:772 stop:1122 length:351 start_codon:yes stop_codon:yes gene_type:complete